MKKALVVFLILAVAGGLFAEISWGGAFSTGIGIGFPNAADADPIIGMVRNRGENGLRVQFVMNGKVATEDYGTFTGTLGVRSGYSLFGGDGSRADTTIEDTKLQWAVPGPLGLTLGIGNGGPGGTSTMGDIDTSLDAGGGWGLAAQLKPVTGLTLAASVIYGAAQKTPDQLVYAAGFKYSAADLLDVAANVKYDQTNADDKKKMDLAAGVSILPIVKAMGFSALAFDVRTNNGLGANNSNIGIGERIGFTAGNLGLTFRAQQLIWTGTDADPGYIPMKFNLAGSYKVSDLVTVGADLRYLIGNKPAFNYRDAGEMNNAAFTAKTAAGLGISPYVTFNVGGPSIQLGYNLQNDMSDGATGATATQQLIYATFNVSF